MRSSIVYISLLAAFTDAVNATERSTVVDLGYSKYEGVRSSNGVTHWSGIRYARPPLGDLRFRAPEDPESTGDQVIQANKVQKSCINSPTSQYNETIQSEDCLFLDLYTPSENKSDLPVFVWIQGGGLSTQGPNANTSTLVTGSDFDMVVVSFNYRVGPWGFLASSEVQADGSLNNGLLDQRKVLKWVQEHISKFGGDPKKVTIGGTSAGGGAVGIHMTAYGGKDEGLFAAVYAEAPSFGFVRTVEQSQYQYDALTKAVNCSGSNNTLSCLRALPVDVIANNNPGLVTPGGGGGVSVFTWSNCIDGDMIRDQTYKQFAAGNFTKVPALYGAATNEGTVFTPKTIDNHTAMNAFLKDNFPQVTDYQLGVIDYLYPQAEQYPQRGSYFSAAADAYGHMRYVCPSFNVSSLLTDAGVSNVYNFHYAVVEDASATNGDGTRHSQGTAPFWGQFANGSKAAGVSPWMQGYFTSFVRTVGDPNVYRKEGSPVWYTFNKGSMQRMLVPNEPVEIGMESVTDGLRERCTYWSNIGPEIGQ